MEARIEKHSVTTGFIGAYEERINKNKLVTDDSLLIQDNKEPDNVDTLENVKNKMNSDGVIFTQEAKCFLKQIKEAALKEELQIQSVLDSYKSGNVFEDSLSLKFSSNSQALIFSELLYSHGFYDDMSDDKVKATEELLTSIATGMDDLNREKGNNDMSSSVAMAELESSTAALKYFADKYVPEDQKEDFNKLIEQYYDYNNKRVMEHRSVREICDELSENIPTSNISNPNQKQKDAISGYAVSKLLGNVVHTEDDKQKLKELYSTEISKILNGTLSPDDTVNKLRLLSNEYSSGGNRNSNVIQILDSRNINFFSNMSQYWNSLISY